MAGRVRGALFWGVVGLVLFFVVFAVLRSAPRRTAPVPPDLAGAPARVYGVVEPLGGPAYVAARVPRSVARIVAREGDTVKAGAVLVVLESAAEEAQLSAALGRAEAARQAWAISREAFARVSGLHVAGGVSVQEYRQAMLKAGLDSASATAAEAEAELARAQLAQLTLTSPIDGLVYKLDVRLGQTLAAGDDSRIIVGAVRQQARMFVESFWLNRVRIGDVYRIRDSETDRDLGTGRVVSLSPYVGGRTVRTEDTRERFDAEYQVTVLALDTVGLPLGLNVVAEVQPVGK